MEALANSIAIGKVSTIWTPPPICYATDNVAITNQFTLKSSIASAVIENFMSGTSSSTAAVYSSLAIMAMEIGTEGKRQFFIGTWPAFWKTMMQSSVANRLPLYYYEVIPKDHSVPLYMDIDIPMTLDANQMKHLPVSAYPRYYAPFIKDLDAKIEALIETFEQFLKLKLNIEKCFTLFMTAHRLTSMTGKYSVHLIMHLNGGQTRFKTCQDLEYFFSDFIAAAKEDTTAGCGGNTLFYRSDAYINIPTVAIDLNQKPVCLIDQNAYRNNCELRLPYSSKMREPERAFQIQKLKGITEDALDRFFPKATSRDERLLYVSLLTFIPETVTVTEFIVHERACTSKKRKNYLSAEDLLAGSYIIPNANDDSAEATTISSSAEDVEKDLAFFDLLMTTIQTQIPAQHRGNLSVIKVIPPGIVVMNSTATYCEIKKNAHRRNHVFWVAILKTGSYYQRCFDEDCVDKYHSNLKMKTGATTAGPQQSTIPARSISETAKGRIYYFGNFYSQFKFIMGREGS